jgi:FixJ family two-component response regulator
MSASPIRIAVVDDDRSVRTALRRLLTATGFDAAVFASGREFLGLLREWEPDCLIIDLNMPGMTGRELVGRVLERIPDLPVIFMTAVDRPESRAEYDALGAIAYLTKPVEEHDLLSAIGAALKIVDRDLEAFVHRPELDQSPIAEPVASDT